jgi:mycothiol synthase
MAETGTGTARLEVVPRLEPGELERVAWLAEQATDVDGVRPLSEGATLALRHGGGDGARELLLWAPDGALAAFAHLDTADTADTTDTADTGDTGPSAELVVAPALRRRGYGRALVGALLGEAGPRLRLWAHGDHPGAAALARSLGLQRVRELWRMRRALDATLPEPAVPAGVTVRTFVPGADDEAWVALNARAFAHHPEQGRWTVQDLRLRQGEPWFDPQGLFLAERDGRLVGSHWTKVHPGADGAAPGPVGEVYVVAVDPDAQGLGLGRLLTTVGLRHLRGRGLGTVMLYVDGDNTTALRTYERLGFTRWDVDVVYREPVHPGVGE